MKDSLWITNEDLGLTGVYSGMRKYRGDAARCLDDHLRQITEVQFPDAQLATSTSAHGRPLQHRSATESWSLAADPGYADRQDDSLVVVVLCRTLRSSHTVLAIQTSFFASTWETVGPELEAVINGVDYPDGSPPYEPFTLPAPPYVVEP